MADRVTTFNDLSPRTLVYAAKRMLKTAQHIDVLARYGQVDQLPKNMGDVIKLRRYLDWDVPDAPMSEAIDPEFVIPTFEDVEISVDYFGQAVKITQKIKDQHEDPVFKIQFDKAGKNMGMCSQKVNFNALVAGTNVYYGGTGTTRLTVNGTISTSLLKKVYRQLMADGATPITRRLKAGPNIGTEPVQEGFVVVSHTNMKADIEALAGFTPVHKYPQPESADPGEIGACEGFRFILSREATYWKAAGASGSTYLTNDGNGTGAADVYPMVVLSEDCFSCVPLGGAQAVRPMVKNPGPDAVSVENPFGRFGVVSWLAVFGCGVTNEDWIARIEVGAKQL